MSRSCVVKFLLVLCIFRVYSEKLPPYLKPCSLSDPNLDECCVRNGKLALPYIVRGDKRYNIPNLSPLYVPYLSVDASQGLHVIMTEIYAHGLERTDLKKIRFDVKNKKVSIKLKVDSIQLVGKYEMNGRILVLPIQGNGDFNITAIDGEYQYDFEYFLKRKGGENHVAVKDNDKLEFQLEDAMIKLDNLFNGDEVLSKHMNKFLNENWRDVLSEIGVALSETIRSISRTIITGYFSKISYDQLFLK